MKRKILVVGATGNLGARIVKALVTKNVEVITPVRLNSDRTKINKLTALGAEVREVDMNDINELSRECEGVSCVISSLAGLRDVIVDAQSLLLDAAVRAGVPRFIPSDFSSDFTGIPYGENRNFDLRKEFREHLLKAPVKHTSIFNGAFAEILGYGTPLFNRKDKTIAFYANKQDWKIDFTTMDETAAFTATVAQDENSPSELRIASFSLSPNDLLEISGKLEGQPYSLKNMGSLDELSSYNKETRAQHPEGENQLYPAWQQSQYLYSMFFVEHKELDNGRYTGLNWTPAMDFISNLKMY